jgi:hypothetical protein
MLEKEYVDVENSGFNPKKKPPQFPRPCLERRTVAQKEVVKWGARRFDHRLL